MTVDNLLLMIIILLQVLCVGISFFGAVSMIFLVKDTKILQIKKNYALIGIFINYCLFFLVQLLTYSTLGREIDFLFLFLLDFMIVTIIVFSIINSILFIILDSKIRPIYIAGIGLIILTSLMGIILEYFSFIYYFSTVSATFLENLELILSLFYIISLITCILVTFACTLDSKQNLFFPAQYRYLISHKQLNIFGILIFIITIGEMFTVTSTGPFIGVNLSTSLLIVVFGSLISLSGFIILFSLLYKSREHHKDVAWNIISMQLEELKKMDLLKDQFLAITSHEIRTPLTAITWNVEFIRNEIKKEDETCNNAQHLQSIERNVKQIQRIIEEVIDLVKIQKNLFNYHFESELLDDIINNVIEDTRIIAEKKGLELKFINQIKQKNQSVKMDSDRISQVLRNLIENAIKFTEKGKIEVSFKETLSNYNISIKDSGIGIEKNIIPLIFKPFKKYDDKSYSKGLGLGLFITKRIIEDHKGEINVISEIGKGSTFTFNLPKKSSV